MTHRSETILETVKTRLTGLATTGSRVERARIWAVEECPAIAIDKGDDLPRDDARGFSHQDRQLDFVVTAFVKATGNPESALAQIAAEVYAALFADVTQGLAYVMDTHWIGDAQPEFSTETETRTASMRMSYRIWYRHSITTTEA